MAVLSLIEYYEPQPPEPLGALLDEIDIPDPYRPGTLPRFLQGIALEREPISAHVRRAVMERDRWACRWCDSPDRLQIDHILPVSAGGGSHPINLRVLCASCNGRRGNRQSDRYSASVLPIVASCCSCADISSGAFAAPTAAYCLTCGMGSLAQLKGEMAE